MSFFDFPMNNLLLLESKGSIEAISAVNCTRRGWINIEMDVISYEACGARFLFSTPSSWSLQQVLYAQAHKLKCIGLRSAMYKRPPYSLGSTTPLSQKSTEQIPRDFQSQGMERNAYIDDERGVFAAHMATSFSSIGGPYMSGPKKSSEIHKKSLAGLIHDSSKNKMLFSYEHLVRYFQCELGGISPRGLLNCGNSCYANAVLQYPTCTKPLMV